MLDTLGQLVVRRRRLVVGSTLVLLLVAGVFGIGVAEHLSSGGFQDPGAESTRAAEIVEERFGSGEPNFLLLVEVEQGAVDDPDVSDAGLILTGELRAEPGVEQVLSYWSLGNPPPLASSDLKQALVIARIDGTEDEINDRVEELSEKYTRSAGGITVRVGGFAAVFREVSETIERDLARAEGIAIPITLVLLVLVFGSVVAAALPLAIGVIAIIGTFLVLRVLSEVTQVSIFALNMTTAMGLGLAIDYSLFVVSRYREELRQGFDAHVAVRRTVATAGRTVAFSGFTVAVSLAALLVFPLAFLRSFAYAGIAVVGLAVAGAVVFLPALLAILGTRIDKLTLWRRRPAEEGHGFWHRVATAVMRRPIPIATVVVVGLVLLGVPFLHASFGLPDDRVLPEGASTRRVHDELREGFNSNEASGVIVTAAGDLDPEASSEAIDRYATTLSALEGAARVDAITGHYVGGQKIVGPTPLASQFRAEDSTWLQVVPSVEPMSDEGQELVRSIRQVDAPFPVVVGGPSAQLVDAKESLFGRLPVAGALIGLSTFVLLFLMFGSLLVPAKAVVLNLLSLTATFGAMVWIFQDGHLSGALGFTATGLLDITTPILMFCIAFGLSMDYEVFLLSRIKEEYDRTGDNEASVALGLERTGRIVTAAAAIIAVVFVATAASGITFIKLFGIGLTMAVLMDATVIRGTLVPAFMRLAGRANWWLPSFLSAVHGRFGISESEPVLDGGASRAADRGEDEGVPVEAPPAAPAATRPLTAVGITELRTNASKLVRRAGDGSRYLITVGGRPTAILLPYDDVEDEPFSAGAKKALRRERSRARSSGARR